MPSVRKLLPDEVRKIENHGKGQRKLVEEEYDAILSDYNIGDYGEAELLPEENRLTVRNRLKAAAGRRDLGLEFKRTKEDMLRFRVISSADIVKRTRTSTKAASEPATAPVAAASEPKKRGRKPKVANA